MGSITAYDNNDKFIKEFGADAIKKQGLDCDCVKSQCLGVHEVWEQVVLYATLKCNNGEDVEVIVPTVFFDAHEPEDDSVSRVAELLEISEDEAKDRLYKIGLYGD